MDSLKALRNLIHVLSFFFIVFISDAKAMGLQKLFTEHFYTLHVPGKCGENILRFVELAQREGIDLQDAEIINVNSGWVEPLYVRNGGYRPKAPGPQGLTYPPAPRYYYFHIFLIHQNKVYDFDFGNVPTVVSVKSYFEKMWLTGKARDKSLGLQVYSVEDYLQGRDMPDSPTIPLLKFVTDRSR